MTVGGPATLNERTPRPTAAFVRERTAKEIDAWWTVLLVDPLALPVVRWLTPYSWLTPNGLTALAGVLGVVSAVLFALGHYAAAAIVFEARFFIDCLDGKLARVRGLSNRFGAFFDISSDIALTAACYACLGWSALSGDSGDAALAIAVPTLFLYQYWTWLYLQGTGRVRDEDTADGATHGLVGWLAQHRLALRPRSVDVEAATLFLVPLLAPESWFRPALLCAAVYYAVGVALNWMRTARVLRAPMPDA